MGWCLEVNAVGIIRKTQQNYDAFQHHRILESKMQGNKASEFRSNKWSWVTTAALGLSLKGLFLLRISGVKRASLAISQSYWALGTSPFLGFFTPLHFTAVVLFLSLSSCRDLRPWWVFFFCLSCFQQGCFVQGETIQDRGHVNLYLSMD